MAPGIPGFAKEVVWTVDWHGDIGTCSSCWRNFYSRMAFLRQPTLWDGVFLTRHHWGMELSLQGQWMFLRRGSIITWGTWGGIYKRMLFSPADGHPWQYLHGWILVNPYSSALDAGAYQCNIIRRCLIFCRRKWCMKEWKTEKEWVRERERGGQWKKYASCESSFIGYFDAAYIGLHGKQHSKFSLCHGA